jgi:hypothetical protein
MQTPDALHVGLVPPQGMPPPLPMEQGVPAGARLSGGQSFELPVQNSAELQSPAAGRHSVLDDA